MSPDSRNVLTTTVEHTRNRMAYKYDLLFDKVSKEWMAFKPALGLCVYPCYSCQHIFYTKKSFLDHINRRVIVLKYKCPKCSPSVALSFYNRCAFLLHCRKHYTLNKGYVYLTHLEILSLPMGLAGFTKLPDIPYLFDVEEELMTPDSDDYEGIMNAQFYVPLLEDKGKDVIGLTAINLLVNESEPLALKQIAKNLPKCQFINVATMKEIQSKSRSAITVPEPPALMQVKNEPEDSQLEEDASILEPCILLNTTQDKSGDLLADTSVNGDSDEIHLPIITKVETLLENTVKKCAECNKELHALHFLGENKPENEALRCSICKLICPTVCSFKAHTRIHSKTAPHVCPDCGIVFNSLQKLLSHMDRVCFHLVKSVRFRCPGKRCGKIFASASTFGPHFKQVHIDVMYMCSSCKHLFSLLEECENHCLTHSDESGNIVKLFTCSVCGEDDMNPAELKKHLDFHCNDLSRCIYIFMCKYCKCYFRSVQTMNTHLQNCKVQKTGIPRQRRSANGKLFGESKYMTGYCKTCGTRIICLKNKPSQFCNRCLNGTSDSAGANVSVLKKPPSIPEKCVCILCKAQIDFNERRQHQRDCRYSKPQVLVEKLDLEKSGGGDSTQSGSTRSFSSSNSDLDSWHESSSPHKSTERDDGARPRKRHKSSNKPKSKSSDAENDLTAEGPITFDGTYQCRLCEYKNTDRESFHGHVKTHKNISTAYQCMECGECFVVKPSLNKHLLHFHNITDTEQYFSENDCFDKEAINELAKVVKAPYLANNNVKENQCRVCMEQFDSREEHDKHFRIHGMAFLMRNSM